MNYLRNFIEVINHPFNKRNKLKTIFRILFWKINQLTLRLPTIVSLTKNIKCVCYPENSYGSMVFYCRWPDYMVSKGILDNLNNKDIFVDVGANIGVMSLIAATRTQGKIYSFEPSPTVWGKLGENIHLNNLEKIVKLERLALSNKTGYSFFDDEKTPETSHLSTKKTGIKVVTTTLDKYCKSHGITKIHVLKIDVEGAEYLVLEGAKQMLLNKKISHIFLELNVNCSRYGYKNKDTINLLRKYGYKISHIPKNIDNLIYNVHLSL